MTYWKDMWARFSGGSDAVLMDAATHNLIMISEPHAMIHAGKMFEIHDHQEGGTATKTTITFKTPDTDEHMHIFIVARSTVEAFLTIGEGATVTALSGTDKVPLNRNRNSATVSTLISEGSAGGAGNVTVGAAVTDMGLELWKPHFGSGKVGGEARDEEERELKANTVYVIEVETQATSGEVDLDINIYQHADLD